MKLVDDWKCCWRWVSVNCMILAASLQGAWATVPEYLRDRVPSWTVAVSTVALLILGVMGRLIKQPGTKPQKKKKR